MLLLICSPSPELINWALIIFSNLASFHIILKTIISMFLGLLCPIVPSWNTFLISAAQTSFTLGRLHCVCESEQWCMEEQQLNVWMVSVPYEVHTRLCLSMVPSGGFHV